MTVTADDIAALVTSGHRYWWHNGSTFYATAEFEPHDPDDTYLLDASPGWIAQWNGDWQAACDQLAPLLG